jgi:hypothetical protein
MKKLYIIKDEKMFSLSYCVMSHNVNSNIYIKLKYQQILHSFQNLIKMNLKVLFH